MIILRDTDLPAGLSAQQAVALVYGAERAATDLIVVIRTQYDGPPAATLPAPSLPASADQRSAAKVSSLETQDIFQ